MGNTHLSGLSLFDVKLTVGAESSNNIDVTVQLLDNYGMALRARKCLPFYLANDASGDTPASTAPSGGLSATTGAAIEWANNLSGMLITTSNGTAVLRINESLTPTFYLVIVLPDGSRVVSSAITFS